jgi:hypothetical protein
MQEIMKHFELPNSWAWVTIRDVIEKPSPMQAFGRNQIFIEKMAFIH